MCPRLTTKSRRKSDFQYQKKSFGLKYPNLGFSKGDKTHVSIKNEYQKKSFVLKYPNLGFSKGDKTHVSIKNEYQKKSFVLKYPNLGFSKGDKIARGRFRRPNIDLKQIAADTLLAANDPKEIEDEDFEDDVIEKYNCECP